MSETDPLKALWKSWEEPAQTMCIVDMQARARRFQTNIRKRNFMDYATALYRYRLFQFGFDRA